MDKSPAPEGLPPSLTLLKWLVILLMITMIVGVITVVGLLVTRMPKSAAPIAVPEGLQLPQGVRPSAVTMGPDWIAVVTEDGRILIYGRDGVLRQEVALQSQP
jgi:Flp pilus assembly protein protease CpaA